MTGASIMLMSGEIPGGSLCTSDAASHLIEELQYTLGEARAWMPTGRTRWWPSLTWPIR